MKDLERMRVWEVQEGEENEELIDLCSSIIMDKTTSMEVKIEAMKKMDLGFGMPQDKVDKDDVSQYIGDSYTEDTGLEVEEYLDTFIALRD